MSRPCESAFLLATNPAEAHSLRVGGVQDFDGLAVEDGFNGAGEAGKRGIWEKEEDKT